MKQLFFLLLLFVFSRGALASGECNQLRASGIELLPNSVFDLNYPDPLLQGCFAAYLPSGEAEYQLGIFRAGKLAISLPATGDADFKADEFRKQVLRIKAVGFSDLDGDKKRDILILGATIGAKDDYTILQVYWNCGDRFFWDHKTMENMVESVIGSRPVNLGTIRAYMKKRNIRHVCK